MKNANINERTLYPNLDYILDENVTYQNYLILCWLYQQHAVFHNLSLNLEVPSGRQMELVTVVF